MRTPAVTDSPLDRIRRRYELTPAPAALLLALFCVRGGQPVRRETLAGKVGRSHRRENIGPHLVVLRKRVSREGIVTTATGNVTLAPALRDELRALLS